MNDAGLKVSASADTQIVMTRVFDAPARLVFAALTQPELLKRWLGARGWELVECEIDLRVGGAWRFGSHGPDGAKMGHGGIYREIEPPSRLVYTETYDDQWFPGESLVMATLTEHDEKTTMTTTLEYPSREVRDLVLSSPMEGGVTESYNRLAEVLRQLNEKE